MVSLLPPNATEFERRAEEANRFDTVVEAVDAIAGVKTDIPDAFAAWLAAEWWLADFAPYFASTSALIAAGLPWLRQRGTAAAVQRALSWIPFEALLEEDGARIHLDPGTATAPQRLADIRHLVGRSLPAHVRFYRLFHAYDLRHFRLDRSRLDDGLLDDDSGVVVDALKLSFGTRTAYAFAEPITPAPFVGVWSIYSVTIWDDDGWRLDAWRLDSDLTIDAAGRVISQTIQILAEPNDEEPALLSRSDVVSLLTPLEGNPDPLAMRVDDAFLVLPDMARRPWTGPWSGPWREPIPHNLTQLES